MSSIVAYLDPGSGSMIIQAVVGGLAAAAVSFRLCGRRILTFLRIRKPSEDEQR